MGPGREVGWLHGLITEDVVQDLRSLGSMKKTMTGFDAGQDHEITSKNAQCVKDFMDVHGISWNTPIYYHNTSNLLYVPVLYHSYGFSSVSCLPVSCWRF